MFLFFVLLFFVFVLPSSVIKNDFKTKYRTFCSERRDDKRSVIDRLTHQPMSNKNIIAEKKRLRNNPCLYNIQQRAARIVYCHLIHWTGLNGPLKVQEVTMADTFARMWMSILQNRTLANKMIRGCKMMRMKNDGLMDKI